MKYYFSALRELRRPIHFILHALIAVCVLFLAVRYNPFRFYKIIHCIHMGKFFLPVSSWYSFNLPYFC